MIRHVGGHRFGIVCLQRPRAPGSRHRAGLMVRHGPPHEYIQPRNSVSIVPGSVVDSTQR